MWCVYAQRGCFEWLMHPDDAAHVLEHGVVLDGTRRKVEKICEWPAIGRWHVMVLAQDDEPTWLDASRSDLLRPVEELPPAA